MPVPNRRLQLDQLASRFIKRFKGLGITPTVEKRYLLNARNRAKRGARFLGVVFVLQVVFGITLERYARIAALLRAIVD